MANEDRKQIGLTDDGKATVALLTEQLGWFEEAQEAARFALAWSVREGIVPGQATGTVETRWSPDLFDPTGEIRNLLRVVYPENETPVRLMEYLIDEGLRRIATLVNEGNASPLDLLG
jgi:hypothetical protein